MPNYVPKWEGEVDSVFLVERFPCPHCNRSLRTTNTGYICDRCRVTFNAKEREDGKEADQKDADGHDAKGQEGLLTS